MGVQDNKVVSLSAQRSYSGPLPEPADLQKYDQVVPGAAERIIKMAENEQAKRLERSDSELDLRRKLALRGQWIGLFLAILFTAIAIIFAFNGHEYLATMFGAPLIVWVCSIFVIRKTPKEKE